MTILDILKDITANGSKINKLKIIESHHKNVVLRDVFRLAYTDSIRFGIKKVPEFWGHTGVLSLSNALDFLEHKLAKRVYTGNEAIQKTIEVFSQLSHDDQLVAVRVLTKDLEIGASAASANKVWKKLIKEQPQMLATASSEKALAFIKFPAYAQLKADGARCFIEVRPNGVVMVSRSGKEYQGLEDIAQESFNLWELHQDKYPDGFMIDGELTVHDKNGVTSRTLSNGIMNKSLSGTLSVDEAKNVRHECWDIVDINDYETGLSKALYDERFEDLVEYTSGSVLFITIKNDIVHSLHEARLIYNNYISLGLEGIILKNIKSPWEDKRSKNLVKFKEIYPIDLEIIDYYLHKKDSNKIGGFTCKTSDGIIVVDVGSGLSDTDQRHVGEDVFGNNIYEDIPIMERDETNRARLYQERDTLKGRIIEAECNGYLFNKKWKEGDSLSTFLGVFKKFRNDKKIANTFDEAFGISLNEAVDKRKGK